MLSFRTRPVLAGISLALLSCAGGEEERAPASPVAAALPVYQEALRQGLGDPGPATRAVHASLSRGRNRRALEQALAAVEAAPESSEAAFTYGVVLNQTSSFDEARAQFERALALGPSFVGSERVFYLYGLCLLRLGESEAAREALDAALALRPEDGEIHLALGQLELQEGRAAASLPHFRRAIARFDAVAATGDARPALHALAHFGHGDALLQLGRTEDALPEIQASIRLNPTDVEAWYKLSRVLRLLGNDRDADRALQQYARRRSAR